MRLTTTMINEAKAAEIIATCRRVMAAGELVYGDGLGRAIHAGDVVPGNDVWGKAIQPDKTVIRECRSWMCVLAYDALHGDDTFGDAPGRVTIETALFERLWALLVADIKADRADKAGIPRVMSDPEYRIMLAQSANLITGWFRHGIRAEDMIPIIQGQADRLRRIADNTAEPEGLPAIDRLLADEGVDHA